MPLTEDRHAWRAECQPLMRAACHRLAFLDRTSVTNTMPRPRGRSCEGSQRESGRGVERREDRAGDRLGRLPEGRAARPLGRAVV